MTLTLKEFLTARAAEINKQIADLRAELKEIQAATEAVSGNAKRLRASNENFTLFKKTIKEMVVQALEMKETLEGVPQADALEIIEIIKDLFGKEIPRPSISPQLSRLKAEGVLDLRGKVWILLKKNSAPEGAEDGALTPSDHSWSQEPIHREQVGGT